MGHFRVPPGLCSKRRLSAQPLIWKWLFILVQIKLIFTRKVVHLASFWKWGFWNLEVAYNWHQRATLLVCENTQILMNPFITDSGRGWGFFPKTCLLSHEKKLMFLGEDFVPCWLLLLYLKRLNTLVEDLN